MSATLAGNIALQSGGALNVVVRFFTPNTQTEVFKYARATDASGNFTITGITPGTYDVGVKAQGGLSILAQDKVFTEGNTTTINFGTMYMGDIYYTSGDEDYIGSGDYSLVVANQDKVGDCYGYAGNWLMPTWPTGGGGIATKLNRGLN